MSKKPILFEDAGSDSDVEIKTNNDYATHYDKWRQKEEMNRLKTKYGDHYLSNSSNKEISDNDSSSSEDDEDGRELTEEFEKDFFKTLSCLKNKDPKIYDEKVVFFENKNEQNISPEKKKSKKEEPMFLKDYERKMILEKGAKFEDSDEEETMDPRSNSPTYVQQQHKLKESLKDALNEDDNDDEHWGGLFSKRDKTKEEQDREEQDYKKWLKGAKDQLDNKEEETALKPLKEYWNKPDLDNTEKFLRDYLLNKRYLENEDNNHIPSYEEIIHDSDEGLSEDEDQIEKQEEFEHKYNFRFEEPDHEFIKRYPRTLDQSVRKTDDRRKLKRQEIKQRKEEEKKQKQEEIKQLKIYKRKEIEEKIQMLKEITGNEEMAFQNVDLDADFDPEEHDKRMHELFNDDYYKGEEGDQKPEFSDLEEELGPWKDNNEPHCEDDDFIMDADYDPSTTQKKTKKEKKKRNRLGKHSKNTDVDDLPIDKNDERYEEYMDELYKLDCEDMIGDLPCRFKYRDVLANDFGLTVEEILLARDKELNRWCSLKKTMQYRPEHMEKYDVLTYKRKAMNDQIKKKLLPSLYDESLLEEDALKEEQVAKMNKHKVFEGIDNTYEDKNEEIEVNAKKGTKKQKQKDESPINNQEEIFEGIDETSEDENEEINVNNKKQKDKSSINNQEEIGRNKETTTKGKKKEQKIFDDTSDNKNEEIEVNTKKENTKKSKKIKQKINNQKEISKAKKQKIFEGIDETSENKNEEIQVNTKNSKKKREISENDETSEDKNVNRKEEKKTKKQQNQTEENKKKRKHSESNENNADDTQKAGLSRRQRKNKKKILSKSNESNLESKPKKESRKRKLSTKEGEGANNNPKKKQKLNKTKKKQDTENLLKISDARLEAYGINPKKFKNKLKYRIKNNLKNKKNGSQ